MKTQFITNSKGKKVSVILPIRDYTKMLDDLEELEDIRAFDEARIKNEPTISLREAIEQRKLVKNA